MSRTEQIYLFAILKALDRASAKIKAMGSRGSNKVATFIDQVWGFLSENSGDVNTFEINKALDSLVRDEQGLGPTQMIKNMYYCAISDLVVFIEGGGMQSLEAAEGSIIELYEHMATQRFLLEKMDGKAVVLSPENESEIDNDSEYIRERDLLASDKLFAENINNWKLAKDFR